MTLSEDLLYYVWQTKSFDHSELKTEQGETIEIINYGIRNVASGPDFLNGKIIIGGIIWAGNIEMHILTSDWLKHKHQYDNAYKNVILHVVYEHDLEDKVLPIPVLKLKSLIKSQLIVKYKQLMANTAWIPCEQMLPQIDLSHYDFWINTLAVERFQRKTQKLKMTDAFRIADWQQLLYEQIAKYFGGIENAACFENLAIRLPYILIQKNIHDTVILEALVFGIAGYFEKDIDDDYFQKLKREYAFQKKKLQLTEINLAAWRNFGMYAAGLPSFRLAQFAGMLSNQTTIFDQFLHAHDIASLRYILKSEPNEYWRTHFIFGKTTSNTRSSLLTTAFKDRLIINAILPVLFLYGSHTEDEGLKEKCLDLLSELKAESNAVLKKWKTIGMKNANAMHSQALLELKTKYCDCKRCLSCGIGRKWLS